MEYLNVGLDLLENNWGTVAAVVSPFVVPNKWVESVCFGAGKALSLLFRRQLGSNGEQVEKYFQGTIAAAVKGLNEGLDADDGTKVEKQ